MTQKIGVLIGRFQPLHEGHKALIKQAAARCDHLVILVGSANKPRSLKNPWTFKERKASILSFIANNVPLDKGFSVLPISDYRYSDALWVHDVIETVNAPAENVTLYGHDKPGNSYLKYFPQWKYQELSTGINVCATDIRKTMFKTKPELMPESVMDDHRYFKKEKEAFANYPFKETLNFNCGDAVLECAGHILLIQRKFAPGRGTWALPGGFKNANETFEQTAIRELMEETNVRVPEKVLRGSIVNRQLFDAPDRGCGIPRNTLAVHIRIEPEADGSLPRANGRDDAMACKWVAISDILNNYELFDDHLDIIQFLTKTSGRLAVNNSRFTA